MSPIVASRKYPFILQLLFNPFFQCFNLFFLPVNEHDRKCNYQQHRTHKDRMSSQISDRDISHDRTKDKERNNSKVKDSIMQAMYIPILHIITHILCGTPQVTDTHCCSNASSMNLTETLYLNTTREVRLFASRFIFIGIKPTANKIIASNNTESCLQCNFLFPVIRTRSAIAIPMVKAMIGQK